MQEYIIGMFKNMGNDVLFLSTSIINNSLFLRIGGTLIVLIFFIGLLIAKNMKNLNAALDSDSLQGFQKIAHQGSDGTYNMAYSVFVQMRSRLRKFFLYSLILLFCTVILMVSM